MIEAVTFDFWNTLIYEDRGELRGRRLAAWVGILEDAGFAVERERLDAAFETSWQSFLAVWQSGTAQYTATHAAVEVVEDLGFDVPPGVTRGVRLGIICDVGMTPSIMLRSFLSRHGVLDRFDHWSFSDEVGCYKPSPAIFDHALDGLGGVAPDRAAHVGDLRRTDIAGARGMGMTAVRYTGVFDDSEGDSAALPDAHHVIAHHSELLPALGLA